MQIELNYPDPLPLELDAGKSLLLIVDMENEDARPSGKRFAVKGGLASSQISRGCGTRCDKQADP